MHTFEATEGTTFQYSSDFSGPVYVITNDGKEVEIPGADLLELIAKRFVLRERVRMLESSGEDTPARIAALEKLSAEDLLRGQLLVV